ncbi:helicase-related protein, partial [bacterium]|nr:helicase-related protein [bacterium]
KWIKREKEKAAELRASNSSHSNAADRHVGEMEKALARMNAGFELLEKSAEARQIFEWTNRAMHLQSAVPRNVREPIDFKRAWNFEKSFDPRDNLDIDGKVRKWRPFQIAFLLMNLPGLHSVKSADREIVDLIWFPTGGGKTEAYLACAAYTMFRRRQLNPYDIGTEVVMRYTLRLLTAQQFERASALICAMNILREEYIEILGEVSYTIGIWVGGSTTPNIYAPLQKKPEEYNLVLLKCPWCAAKMGPRPKGRSWVIEGYTKKKEVFHCTDQNCHFYEELPLHVIDQHLYENPPTYLIATVDKFAMLAWNDRPRAFFGIGRDGSSYRNPPGLIIQDELHLITGPLGSMVGLYESVIHELCTTRADGSKTCPKLIAATATTRASSKQISDLYARPRSGVFPPPGLDASDSFFAKHDIDEEGRLMPAREYLGFLGVNYSSALTSSVRLTSALHCAAWMLPEDERDPWWTLLYFYNSIRELGGGLSLYDADIKERMKNVQGRWIGKYDKEKKNYRWINQSRELTGRLQNSEIPERLKELEYQYDPDDRRVLDACLASNIIEVGVDVDRLSLMAVQGQPKTTAQYIQATGRIGRNTERPGLVVVNYGAQKGRDRSHYEQFQAYHDRLYAAVEPSSVTPFTLPVMKRALHSAMAAWIRQSSHLDQSCCKAEGIADLLKTEKDAFMRLLSDRVDRLEIGPSEKSKLLSDIKQL